MTKIFITGTSRGIGEAIAKELLKEESNKVCGISRSNSIVHDNFVHVSRDLSNIDTLAEYEFPREEKFDKYILINNAGMVEPVGRVGKLNNIEIQKAINLNLIAPSMLMNKFIASFNDDKAILHIINVSSGAGKHPIDGWAVYNTSKAGLDMFSKVLAEEFLIDKKENIFIHSIAPGIVDTKMQDEIRSKNKESFSNIERFKDYHKNGDLNSPENVAKKFMEVINKPSKFKETVISIRDF